MRPVLRSLVALGMLAAFASFAGACGGDCDADVTYGTAADWAELNDPHAWEWILESDAIPATPPAVAYVGVDLYDVDAAWIEAAHAQGTTVWCYMSVGSAERYRDDVAELEAIDAQLRAEGREGAIGRPLEGWAGERWLNVRAYEAFMPVMRARVALCAEKGFDMVEFDNVDAWDNNTGFDVTQDEQVAYLQALVSVAEEFGLLPILKNGTELPIEDALRARFGGLLMEACVLYDFCDAGAPFEALGLPVWNVEYPDEWVCDEERSLSVAAVCADAPRTTLLKRWDLNADTVVCAAQR